MADSSVESVLVNFRKRTVTIFSDQGEERVVAWKHDREGADGFSETIAEISAKTWIFDLLKMWGKGRQSTKI